LPLSSQEAVRKGSLTPGQGSKATFATPLPFHSEKRSGQFNRQLLLRRTKGGRSDRRHLPARLSPILSLYIRSWSPRAASDGEALFVARHGQPLSPRGVQYRFAYWLRRVRIQKPLSVHSLRHTFGTLLYQATKDLLLVSRALGHRDVKSTVRYAHLGDQQLARAVIFCRRAISFTWMG